ncbi:phosphoribosylglycinamide formyltransferase, partial [Candidatus Erwinia dacicola]
HALAAAQFADRAAFDHQLMLEIDAYAPDLVVLAGCMRILSAEFVQRYAGRMLNIHPSLLPKYPGLHTHRQAIENGDEEHGTSVHFVTEELDGGPVILQAKVPVFSDDSEEDVTARVQHQEHAIYPLVVSWFVDDRLTMRQGAAWLDGQQLPVEGHAFE